MGNELTKQRLYFTDDRICIGSYDEVAKYEQETQQSYWASDFFQLPPDYNPIEQTLDDINLVQSRWLQSRK
jgi:hypothetical protein